MLSTLFHEGKVELRGPVWIDFFLSASCSFRVFQRGGMEDFGRDPSHFSSPQEVREGTCPRLVVFEDTSKDRGSRIPDRSAEESAALRLIIARERQGARMRVSGTHITSSPHNLFGPYPNEFPILYPNTRSSVGVSRSNIQVEIDINVFFFCRDERYCPISTISN